MKPFEAGKRFQTDVFPEISTLRGICAQTRAEPETITLFNEWTRLTTNNHGEMHSEPLQGLFYAQTRLMTGYEIRINNKPISHRLSAQLSQNEWTSTGALLRSGDSGNLKEGTLPRGSIEARILRRCEKGMIEQVFVKNNGFPRHRIHLEIRLFCPILDSEFDEEMKEDKKVTAKGIRPQVSKKEDGILLHYERCFGKRKKTPVQELQRIYGSDTPKDGEWVTHGVDIRVTLGPHSPRAKLKIKRGRTTSIHLWCRLGAREEVTLQIAYEPFINEIRMKAPKPQGLCPPPQIETARPSEKFQISSSHSTLNLVMGQAISDLESLRLPLFGHSQLKDPDRYRGFIAGVPRYMGVFGRDTLITGWQSILFEPEYLEPALARVALFQGVQRDDWRDEEPDRMLHERRLDPQSQTGKMNRNLYYGDVTSTPFWILALSSLYHWTGERALVARHQSTLERCCHWILKRLQVGNGFIFYKPAFPSRLDENRNQAWKDSGDAIVDEKGHIRTPPLALAEIQGYAYEALIEAAEMLKEVDSKLDRGRLRWEAEKLKEKFNRSFWVEEDQFFALALDGQERPLRAKASNIGHCLGTGIIEDSRVDAVVQGLMRQDLYSGWGIRTLSCDNPGYDPASYHRGSVWPVENAIIADGMALLGYHNEAQKIIGSQLSLAALFQHMRLPEVFGGQPRSPDFPLPGIYNFANLLQAWSVSAISQFIQSLLGVWPRADQGILYLTPVLPEWIQWMKLENVKIGESLLDLYFWRESKTLGESVTRVRILRQKGNLRVIYRSGQRESLRPRAG